MDLTPLYKQLREELVELIKTKKFEVDDAMTLVVVGIQILNKSKNLTGKQKQEVLVAVLEDIAKGNDGQFGTADDVIPEKVWKQVEVLMSSELLHPVINVCHSLLTGRFPNVFDAGFQLFNFCNKVFGKKENKQ
jgi:hypothetical protein